MSESRLAGLSNTPSDIADERAPALSTPEFLALLRRLDIIVQVESGRLLISARPRALSAILRAELERRKPEIIKLIGSANGKTAPEAFEIARVSRDGELPLSLAQTRLWLLDKLAPGGAAYTILTAARFRGRLDPDITQKSLTEITNRHETLRTCFPEVNGKPRLLISPLPPPTADVIDLRELPSERSEERARAAVAEAAAQPFDLVNGPLFRPCLIRLREDDHILLVTVHHTVFDEWSAGLLWHEFCALYRAFRNGEPSPLPELPIQYADFATWQRQRLDGPVRESHLAYWKRQLEGCIPTLNLPCDFARSGLEHRPAQKQTVRLDTELSEALATLARQERTSVFMVLLAAFNALCWRLTGQDDILVGTPIAGRDRPETERLIGFFINTIVVRTRLRGVPSFRELLSQIRGTVLDSYEHQEMPFEELVGEFDVQRDLNRTPLFQVFFNHLNTPASETQISGLEVEMFGDAIESKFDLTIYSAVHNGSIQLSLLYNAQLFSERRMELFLDQYSSLLKQICTDPTLPLERYSLVTVSSAEVLPDATAPLVSKWTGAVHQRFLEHASRAPEQVAISQNDSQWTYRNLEQISGGLATWLRRHGVGSGDVVAIYGDRCASLVAAVLAVLRAGSAFSILDPSYPAAALAIRVKAMKPKAWFQIKMEDELADELAEALKESAGDLRLGIPRSKNSITKLASPKDPRSEPEVGPDSPAYVTFTSGTTGGPKCILGTHGPISHFVTWHAGQFGLTAEDRFSMLSGLAHDPLLRDIFTPLCLGATLCIPTDRDIFLPGRLLGWTKSSEITVAHLTPAMGVLLTQGAADSIKPTATLPSLRYAFFGGDTLTSREVERLAGIAPNAQSINFYGATETPQAMAWHRVQRAGDVAGSGTPLSPVQIPVGTGIADTQLLILNSEGKLAGIGEPGQIHIRTPYLTVGYINDEALTKSRFLTNPFTGDLKDRVYRTGDLGRYRPDGSVEFAGRSDSQIKVRGFRVELGEIEAAIAAQPGVQECAVVAKGHGVDDRRLVAYLVVEGAGQASPVGIRERLARLLPEHMTPSSFAILPTLPLTPNGKVDRRALALRDDEIHVPADDYVPPTNHVERVMADVWSELLEVDKVSVHANFFQLGGHSLKAVSLIARLQSAFGIDLPLRCIFIDPTIAGLARHIRYDVSSHHYQYVSEIPRWSCLVPAQPRGTRTPFFFVAGYMGPDDTLLVLSHLIPHLGSHQPIFGFRPRWVEDAGEAYSSVAEVASEFLAELRTVQPRGPYLLGGHCVGGVVALEIARQLMLEGEEVRLLAMVDTERPNALRSHLANIRLLLRRAKHIGEVIAGIILSKERSKVDILSELIRRKLGPAPPGNSEATPSDRLYGLRIGYRRLIYSHTMEKYPGRITLIANEQQYAIDKNLGWAGVSEEGLAVHKLPGDHDTLLTIHGKELSELLLRCIDEVTPETWQRTS